jgi:hypothetical protein
VGIEQHYSWRNAAVSVAYFAAKAAMNSIAVQYSRDLSRWGFARAGRAAGNHHGLGGRTRVAGDWFLGEVNRPDRPMWM